MKRLGKCVGDIRADALKMWAACSAALIMAPGVVRRVAELDRTVLEVRMLTGESEDQVLRTLSRLPISAFELRQIVMETGQLPHDAKGGG